MSPGTQLGKQSLLLFCCSVLASRGCGTAAASALLPAIAEHLLLQQRTQTGETLACY